jgi:hypothetical protein
MITTTDLYPCSKVYQQIKAPPPKKGREALKLFYINTHNTTPIVSI